jgi:hypothetical protein
MENSMFLLGFQQLPELSNACGWAEPVPFAQTVRQRVAGSEVLSAKDHPAECGKERELFSQSRLALP